MHALPVMPERDDARTVSQQIARLCEAIFRELQARSFAARPPTEWELEESARQARKYRIKEERIFGERESGKRNS